MARANISGALQAGRNYYKDPYLRLQAPGVIEAQYKSKAGDAIQNTFNQLGSLVLQIPQMKQQKELMELRIEGQKKQNALFTQQGITELQKSAATHAALKGITGDDGKPIVPDDFGVWHQQWTDLYNKAFEVSTDTEKVPKKKSSTSDISGTSDKESSFPGITSVNYEQVAKDALLFNNNSQSSYNKIRNASIDPYLNRDAAVAKLAINGDGFQRPEPVIGKNGVLMNRFSAYVDEGSPLIDDNSKEVINPETGKKSFLVQADFRAGAFDTAGNGFGVLDAPVNVYTLAAGGDSGLKTFQEDFESGRVISPDGWTELNGYLNSNVFNNPNKTKSLESQTRLFFGRDDITFKDVTGDGKFNGEDYQQIMSPIINAGAKTKQQLQQEAVQFEYSKSRARALGTQSVKGADTTGIDIVRNIEGDINTAVSQDNLNYFNRPGAQEQWITDENENRIGVQYNYSLSDQDRQLTPSQLANKYGIDKELAKEWKRNRVSTKQIFFDNPNDVSEIVKRKASALGQKSQDAASLVVDEHFAAQNFENEVIDSIKDVKGEDGKTKLGASEDRVKSKFKVSKIYQLPERVKAELVNRQRERGGLKNRLDLLTYLEINIPETFDISSNVSTWPSDILNQLGNFKSSIFTLNK